MIREEISHLKLRLNFSKATFHISLLAHIISTLGSFPVKDCGRLPYPVRAIYCQLNNFFMKRPITLDYSDPGSYWGSQTRICALIHRWYLWGNFCLGHRLGRRGVISSVGLLSLFDSVMSGYSHFIVSHVLCRIMLTRCECYLFFQYLCPLPECFCWKCLSSCFFSSCKQTSRLVK